MPSAGRMVGARRPAALVHFREMVGPMAMPRRIEGLQDDRRGRADLLPEGRAAARAARSRRSRGIFAASCSLAELTARATKSAIRSGVPMPLPLQILPLRADHPERQRRARQASPRRRRSRLARPPSPAGATARCARPALRVPKLGRRRARTASSVRRCSPDDGRTNHQSSTPQVELQHREQLVALALPGRCGWRSWPRST